MEPIDNISYAMAVKRFEVNPVAKIFKQKFAMQQLTRRSRDIYKMNEFAAANNLAKSF